MKPVCGTQSEGETDLSLSISKDDVEGLGLSYEASNMSQALKAAKKGFPGYTAFQ